MRRLRGRWPWAVEKGFEDYGDVVRIAPNEIAIFGYKPIVGKFLFCEYSRIYQRLTGYPSS